MKETDLRIGNFVYDSTGNTHKIEGVYPDRDYSKYKPIPLTEEWLLKLGFENQYNSKYRNVLEIKCDKNNYYYQYVFFKNDDVKYFDFIGKYIDCNYVHQLQNLYYCLTGEELKLNE